jgi:hypothetical protein
MLTYRERTSTDLESVLGATPQEFESLILRHMRGQYQDQTRYAIDYRTAGGDYHLASSVRTGSGSGHRITLTTGGGNVSIA